MAVSGIRTGTGRITTKSTAQNKQERSKDTFVPVPNSTSNPTSNPTSTSTSTEKELQQVRTEAKKKIKEAFLSALSEPLHTGITNNQGEEIILNANRDTSCLLRTTITEYCLELAEKHPTDGDTTFSPDEIQALELNFLPLSSIKKIWNVPVIVRDWQNNFHEIPASSLLKIAAEIDRKKLSLLKQKWKAEYLIDSSSNIHSILSLDWHNLPEE